MSWTLAATCALASTEQPCAAQGVILTQKTDEIPRALRSALAASARGQIEGVGNVKALDDVRAEALEDFNQQLDIVAPLIDESVLAALHAQEDPDIETVLLTIAYDRAERPEAYAELLKTFGVSKSRTSFRIAPPLKAPYDTEPWRLTWEYALLAPASEEIATITYRDGALPLAALAKIQNEASLPVLTHRFRIAVTSSQCFASDATECAAILKVLAKFPTRRGLAAMLECLNVVEAFQETIGSQVRARATKKQTYRDLVQELLSRPAAFNAAEGGTWEAALRECPTVDLSKKDRELVEAALATYGKAAE